MKRQWDQKIRFQSSTHKSEINTVIIHNFCRSFLSNRFFFIYRIYEIVLWIYICTLVLVKNYWKAIPFETVLHLTLTVLLQTTGMWGPWKDYKTELRTDERTMAEPYLSDLDFDEDGIYRERQGTGWYRVKTQITFSCLWEH